MNLKLSCLLTTSVILSAAHALPLNAQSDLEINPTDKSNIQKMVTMNELLTDLLQDTRYQRHLEVNTEQLKEIANLHRLLEVHLDVVMNPSRTFVDDAEKARSWSEATSALTAIDGQLQEVLMPHQLQSYGKLRTAIKLGLLSGNSRAVKSSLDAMLGLSEKQKKLLATLTKEMNEFRKEKSKNLEKEIEAIRMEARKEAKSVLTPSQRKEYDELLGEEISKH